MSTLPDPTNPDFAAQVRASFDAQRAMALIGAQIDSVLPGRVVLRLGAREDLTQQHGFLHGGIVGMLLDTACGFAAFSLLPAGAGILTVEYKLNFLAAGVGDEFRAIATVRKAGRTISVVDADAIALSVRGEKLVATMTATMMAVHGRADVKG